MTTTVLQFLLLSTDIEVLRPVAAAVRELGGNLHCTATIGAATDLAARRKLDGILADLALPDSLKLIADIRSGRSNRQAVIFACTRSRQDAPLALAAGANFLLAPPLTHDKVLASLMAAQSMMVQERRRYFRHEVAVPVRLTLGEEELRVVTTNLSEGGMAIRSPKPLSPPHPVDFHFQLPQGPGIEGRGEITWANTTGEIGVRFRYFRGEAEGHLRAWLERREDVSLPASPVVPDEGTPGLHC